MSFLNVRFFRYLVVSIMALFSLATLQGPVLAQSQATNDLQNWDFITLEIPVTEKIRTSFQVQNYIGNNANGGGITKMNQLQIIPSIGYQLNSHLSAWFGDDYAPTFQPRYNNQTRLQESIILKGTLREILNLTQSHKAFSNQDIQTLDNPDAGQNPPLNHGISHLPVESWGFPDRLSFTHRSMLEDRLIQNVSGTNFRLREYFGASYLLDKQKKWALTAYNEYWYDTNTTSHGPKQGFDQNWLFVGFSRKVSPSTTAQLGYLLNHLHSPNAFQHVIMFNLSMNFGHPSHHRHHLAESN